MSSNRDGDSDGSFTPSDGTDSGERSDGDSDYESEDEEQRSKHSLNLQWTGYGKKTPIILFNAECIFNKRLNMRTVGERYHMTYKFGNSECKIVRNILNYHGFHEVHPNSSDYNIVWTGAHLKPFTLRSMTEFQKINHFPRSYELTRKDRLFKNVQRMQQIKGLKNFDIIPSSYVLPGEYQEFCTAFLKDKGPWIVKPVASSRGRGIFLVNHPDQIPLDENIIVCRYIANPLLIDGFKFDIRLYVAVTSYDPLQIYLYEEGLTRFATVKYEKSMRHMKNQCMHLTNYSVNKKNEEYVKNDDADVEDYGNKWSLGAMLRYLRSNGKDTAALMMKIEDVIIKTIISVELPIATACKMFMPFKGNCFELYGFDIMIDDNYKPWVLEVNLSPSLACDSPLDLKIKGNMLCDLFTLTGIICHDPMMRTLQQSRRNQDIASKMAARAKSARVRSAPSAVKQRPQSAGSLKKGSDSGRESQSTSKAMAGLNSEEIRIVRRTKEEDSRKGGWVRIFPTADSWDLYSSFLQFTTTNNLMLHQKLYPERHKGSATAIVSRNTTSAGSRAKSAYIQLANNTGAVKPTVELAAAYAAAMLRTKRYERKLGTRRFRNKKRRRGERRERRKLVQGIQEQEQEQEESGEDQDEQEENEPDEEPPITERNISQRNNQMSQKSDKETSRPNSEEVIQIVVEKDRKHEHKSDRRTGLATLARTNTESSGLSGVEERLDGDVQDEDVGEKPPPPPPSPPPEPKYNVVDLLQKGRTLSKVQARTAFAMYLVRVQQRLMTDCTSMTQDDMDGLNEQMDLVLRFLKRAAVNLQQSFKVVVPSRKLALNDRRRILAKQLGDFVHVYNKLVAKSQEKYGTTISLEVATETKQETEQLRARKQLEKKHTHLRRAESMDGLDEDKFDRFVHTASEGELEEVLTTYTKINKSASIFLGGKTGGETTQHVPTTGNSLQHVGATSSALRSESQATLNKRKESASSDRGSSQAKTVTSSDRGASQVKTVTGWEDVPKTIHSIPTSSADLRSQHTNTGAQSSSSQSGSQAYASRPATYSTNSAASYANAVQIYTQKLSSLRPKSATSAGQKSDKSLRSRPSSAVMGRPTTATGSAYGSTPDLQAKDNLTTEDSNSSPPRSSIHFSKHFARKDPYNEKVISEALQRLTMRQQARQYSAYNGTSLVPSDISRPTSASGPREHSESHKAWPVHETNSSQNVNGASAAGYGDVGNGDKYVSMEDHVTKNRPPQGIAPKRTHSAIDIKTLEAHRRKQTNINLQSANATFNSFIEDTGPNWQNELAMAYNQVTGVTPQNYHTPSQSSKQYQIIQQQALKQQSKVLLEQSKAKHQAMIAQAHAVQKSLLKLDKPDQEATMVQMYAPKPPIRPGARKAVSAHHRVQRCKSGSISKKKWEIFNINIDKEENYAAKRRTVPEETSLNFQFFTSDKASVNGGW